MLSSIKNKASMISKHPQGPKIKVTFYTESSLINKTHLELSFKKTTEWEVFSDQKNKELEEKISYWMNCYCEGKQPDILLPYSLSHFPPFTEKVLRSLASIPFGSRMSYQEMAILLENNNAARAVGTACGRNLLPLLIPCHRVLATGNYLGGFSAGLLIKRELLRFEGIPFLI